MSGWKRTAAVTGASIGGVFALLIMLALVVPPAPAGSTAAPNPTATPIPAPTKTPSAEPGTALAGALALTTKGRAPKTGYDRDRFGAPWTDTDGNGCDQRQDVLNRDLIKKKFDGCLVLDGILQDPYTGRIIHFRRGPSTSSAVQIDHVVALSDAWQKGAQQWPAHKRLRFANDTLNLYAVDGPTNASKGDGDTATWLPPNKSFRCTYVAHQVAVKKKYRLWVTAAERAAMVRVLTACPTLSLPTAAVIPGHPAPRPEPTSTPPIQQSRPPADPNGGPGKCAPGYSPCIPPYPPDLDCADVTGPIIVTGSDPHRLDGDHDGIACEDG
ncbi:DUF1524 domain-containing protein [Microlunatus sp. Gsoil 973]|nr:DUF1524 domain-containing protein [Microlunatus sp. Gsoil 973]